MTVLPLTLYAVWAVSALAAPLNVGGEEIAFEELQLVEDATLGGRSVLYTGQIGDGETKHFFVPGVDVMSPTSVTVLVEDPALPVRASLHRHYWNEPDLAGKTDETGTWTFTGRIDDSVGIAIAADGASRFAILFWSGDAVPPDVPTVFFDGGRPVEPKSEGN